MNRKAYLEDIEFMVGGGMDTFQAAERAGGAGYKVESLYRQCLRAGRLDIWEQGKRNARAKQVGVFSGQPIRVRERNLDADWSLGY